MKQKLLSLAISHALGVMRGQALLSTSYASDTDIPTEYLPLFSEQGGKWVLTGISGIKTDSDIQRLQESLRKERDDHKATKSRLAAFSDLDPEEVVAKLDRIAELEAAAGGKIDEAKLNEMVEARIRTRTAPLERKIATLEQDLQAKDAANKELTLKEKTRLIHDHIRKAATAAKIRDTAIEDAIVLGERVFDVDENGSVVTRDNVGVTPGLSADVWLTEQQTTRPHWWPESNGVGAKGGNGLGGGANPFSHENWNLTAQGQMLRTDPKKAEQMAKSAGTTVGGMRPAPRK